MKWKFATAALACLCLSMLASAGPVHNPRSPLLGAWALDLTKMPVTYGTPPQSVTYTFADVGQGKWQTSIDIVGKDGSVRHMVSRYTRDGQAVKIEGDQLEADSVAVSAPAPNILVMGLAKDKRPGSTRVYSVSADGREMIESAVNVGDDGMPFVRTFHFTRLGK